MQHQQSDEFENVSDRILEPFQYLFTQSVLTLFIFLKSIEFSWYFVLQRRNSAELSFIYFFLTCSSSV